ncbi:hypothetical protein LTR05_005804 [Lithohypha guttulata]|uniref:NmrA-like domain-containing protein n=1 Tax=Lithohypha guttulata TaxID=1690604 RepID=A0AAN7SYB8_9EURO|nr:hypothetical protein LTR05_005804 [Lithohypha guttulata]
MTPLKRLPTVAIAGGSGHLDIILLKRKTGNKSAQEKSAESTTRYYDEANLADSLKDVDVLINTIGTSGYAFRDQLLSAVAVSNVKLYIPSEFGVDHTVHDFDHPEWDHKKIHFNLANETLRTTRICRIFIGLFTEDSIGPWFGFNTKDAVYECIGSQDTPVSFTALVDVGKAVAQLSRMPVDTVPSQLHLGGDTVTVRDIAQVMEKAGSSSIRIIELDLPEFKRRTLNTETSDPSQHIRFLMGEGRVDHSENRFGNDNQLVNKDESIWKWMTMKQYASESKGRPWSGVGWSGSDLV